MSSLLISLWILFVRAFLGMVFHNVYLISFLGNHVLQVMLFIALHDGVINWSYQETLVAWWLTRIFYHMLSLVWRWSWIYFETTIGKYFLIPLVLGQLAIHYEVDIYWSTLQWLLSLITLFLAMKWFCLWLPCVFLESYGYNLFTWTFWAFY